MQSNLAESLSAKRALHQQKEALERIPETREMPHYEAPTTLPGPEVHSMKAAEATEELRTRGKDR